MGKREIEGLKLNEAQVSPPLAPLMDESLSRSIGRRDDHGTGRAALSLQGKPAMFQSTNACHCEPVRAWQSSLLTFCHCEEGLVENCRGNPVWVVTRDAGAMRGLPGGSAGLPRRGAPRNDNGGRDGTRRLDCRVGALPLLAMTTGAETYAWASLAWLGPAPPWAKARFAPPCLSPRPSSFRPWLPYWLALKPTRKPRVP